METITQKDRTTRKKTGRPSITDTTKDQIVKMYKLNFPVSMITEQCEVSRSTVYRILRERTVDE